MGYAQDMLRIQLENNSRNKDFGSFDVNNITATQLNKLRNDIYGGYKTTTTDTYGRTGRNTRGKTGTSSSLNSNYYQTHAGWRGVAGKLGISNINSENDVRQMYDFVSGYRPPAPAAAPAPAPAAPAPLMPQISAASQQYRAETAARETAIQNKINQFNATEAAATKAREIAEQTRKREFAKQEQARVRGAATAAANESRSNRAPSLQIQPASSTPKTAGTDAFRIRKRRGSDQKQLTSSLNIGQSNTLNI